MRHKQTAETFWSRVNVKGEDACWEWTGGCNTQGYGQLSWDSRIVKAHRVAAWLSGKLVDLSPPHRRGDTHILHQCDNPKCCNPEHLKLGTHEQNMEEARARKRWPSGAKHPQAKLTNNEVQRIRTRYTEGDTQAVLSSTYGVSVLTIGKIVRGESYL